MPLSFPAPLFSFLPFFLPFIIGLLVFRIYVHVYANTFSVTVTQVGIVFLFVFSFFVVFSLFPFASSPASYVLLSAIGGFGE